MKNKKRRKRREKRWGGGIYIGDFSMTHECYPYQNKVKNTN
jgi:hypothetical protein